MSAPTEARDRDPGYGHRDLEPPMRWHRPSVLVAGGLLAFLALFLHGFTQAGISFDRLGGAVPRGATFLGQAMPPDTAILPRMLDAMLLTFQMALIGTVAGIALSLPAAILAARTTSPHPLVAYAAQTVITTLRAIPELVWALLFIVMVGLGPMAGILAITVDVIGFAGRFFAERIEELEAGPIEALRATGAAKTAVIACAIVPGAFASFTGTSLYCLEKSVRSAVILGLVGAGGIGVELSTSMTLRRFDEAATIILVILATLLIVERLSVAVRRRVL